MDMEGTKTIITLRPSASLHIKGNFTLFDAKGNKIESASEVFLCRCGKSARMPFCDGSHRKA
jgi:CDGSH iron-sulfur domain-containing protein 3